MCFVELEGNIFCNVVFYFILSERCTSPFFNLSPILEAIKGHEEDLVPLSLQKGA